MDLFMVEVRVGDWPGAVSWYRDVLGLPVRLVDEAGRFALLGAGPGQVALKGSDDDRPRGALRLVFRVEDVEAERARLVALGVAVGDMIVDEAEGYREIRLEDPDGTPIGLFDLGR